jgi:hypothetical protein
MSTSSSSLCESRPHPTHRLLICAALCAVLAALALSVDLPVWRAVRAGDGSKLPGDVRKLLQLSEAFAHGMGVALCLLTVCTLDLRGFRLAPRLALSAYGAGLLADFCKLQVARVRPKFSDATAIQETFITWFPWLNREALPMEWKYKLMSFPSGHTATAVGLAVVLSYFYPRGRLLFALFAVLAAMQRLEGGSHYLSDTLAGASIGLLVGAAACGEGKLARWLTRYEAKGTPA